MDRAGAFDSVCSVVGDTDDQFLVTVVVEIARREGLPEVFVSLRTARHPLGVLVPELAAVGAESGRSTVENQDRAGPVAAGDADCEVVLTCAPEVADRYGRTERVPGPRSERHAGTVHAPRLHTRPGQPIR
jgi:hypothetical protein